VITFFCYFNSLFHGIDYIYSQCSVTFYQISWRFVPGNSGYNQAFTYLLTREFQSWYTCSKFENNKWTSEDKNVQLSAKLFVWWWILFCQRT
jgi:hypothetical protein